MITLLTDAEIEEARALDASRTQGDWQWYGNVKQHEVYLSTVGGGRVFVMQFERWGMQSGQPRFQVRLDGDPGSGVMRDLNDLGPALGPQMIGSHRNDFAGIGHPDARFIAAAPRLVRGLLATVDHLRAVVAGHAAAIETYEAEANRQTSAIMEANVEQTRRRAELERVTKERDETIAACQDAAAKAAEAVEMWPEIKRLRARVATLEAEKWPEDNVGHAACGSCQYNASHGAEAEELRKGVEVIIEDSDEEDGTRHALIELLDRIDARDSLAYVTELYASRAEVSRLTAIVDAARSPVRDALEALDEGAPDPPLNEDGTPQTSPASLVVAARCECCGAKMEPGTPVGTFWDDDLGEVLVHWGKCPEPERLVHAQQHGRHGGDRG